MKTKILSRARLAKIISRSRSGGKKVVFTNGCFDILHIGHVTLLQKARSLGDILVVGLNSDLSVKALKGDSRPVNKVRERAAVLAALGCVDYVTVFGERTPYGLIKLLRPDVLVKGGDWRIKDIVGGDIVKASGGRVIAIPFVKGYSTSSLINRIASL
ncbi:MAG: D-glycero-beta-D-manno-heptose 1-phosphate adenylyltransferase [Candidatus Omnitrophota bacterium]